MVGIIHSGPVSFESGWSSHCTENSDFVQPSSSSSDLVRVVLIWFCRLIHRDKISENLPFILESPEMNTLLPGAAAIPPTPAQSGRFDVKYLIEQPVDPRQQLPISVAVDVDNMSTFQLSAKIACLLHRALRHEHYIRDRPGYLPPVTSFSSLDSEIRAATMELLKNDVTNWQVTLDCFAMAVS